MISINNKQLDGLCYDFEYQVTDKDELANKICQLILGNCGHVSKVINGLASNPREVDKKAVDFLIKELEKRNVTKEDMYKIDGWLFQMISWLQLANQNKGNIFFQQSPHSQPSMHGFDGFAIKLTPDNMIERIVITEDKCTNDARTTIRDKVWPEFSEMENGVKNNAIFQQTEALIGHRLGEQFEHIQNDIVNEKHRQYHVSITRQKIHNSDEGRKRLFKDYDTVISGGDVHRRSAATICLDDKEREWMSDLQQRVLAKLKSYI